MVLTGMPKPKKVSFHGRCPPDFGLFLGFELLQAPEMALTPFYDPFLVDCFSVGVAP